MAKARTEYSKAGCVRMRVRVTGAKHVSKGCAQAQGRAHSALAARSTFGMDELETLRQTVPPGSMKDQLVRCVQPSCIRFAGDMQSHPCRATLRYFKS